MEKLDARIRNHDREIEKMCNFHHQGFVDAITELLKVRADAEKLMVRNVTVNRTSTYWPNHLPDLFLWPGTSALLWGFTKELSWKADWSIGSWLSAVWQEQRVQKSPSAIEKFVTESVRKSLSQAIKLHERPSAPASGSGLRCLVNLNSPAFVLAPSWTMSWLQGSTAAVSAVERKREGIERGSRQRDDGQKHMWRHVWLKQFVQSQICMSALCVIRYEHALAKRKSSIA